MFIYCFDCFMTLSKRNDIVPPKRYHPKPKAGRLAATMWEHLASVPPKYMCTHLCMCICICLYRHIVHMFFIWVHYISYRYNIYYIWYQMKYIHICTFHSTDGGCTLAHTHTTRTPRGDSVSSTFLEVQSDGVFCERESKPRNWWLPLQYCVCFVDSFSTRL